MPRLADASGRLDDQAVTAAGLTPEEADQVQEAVTSIWEAAERSVATRATAEPTSSTSGGSVQVYHIAASPDRGEALLDELEKRLTDAVGKQKSKLLCGSLASNAAFGGFGQFDVRIEFVSPRSKSTGRFEMARFRYIDPMDGHVMSKGEMTFEEFSQYFGNSFIVSETN